MKTINMRSTAVAILTAGFLAVGCAPTETKRGTAEFVDDATINTKVKAALVADPDVKGTQINVNTYKGVVQLSGFVNTESEARKATQKAAEVNGVASVRNDLQVKPTR